MTSTQKALLVTEVGKPVVFTTDHPIPLPGAKQIQIRVSVAGLNPHDYKSQGYNLFKDTLPSILSNDVVGKVTKLGDGVAGVAVGDRVVSHAGFAPGSQQNGLQEYAIADVGAFTKIPDSVSDDEAATLPTNIIAPLVGLFSTLKIPAPWTREAKDFDYAGTTLLVIGGGSSCGKFAVQLAKLAGIGQIVVVTGSAEEQLKKWGATHIIDRHGGDDAVLGRIRDVVGDDLFYVFDAISPPEEQILALNALSSHTKGALARLLPIGPVDESKVLGKKAGFEVRDVFGTSQAWPELCGEFWSRVPEYLETGKIEPLQYVVKDGLDAVYVNEVLDAYRDGKSVTKPHIHL